MAKYLVTGGAGFIGSTLVKSLVSEGHDVVVIDNLHTGSKDNLSDVLEKITFIESSVEDADLSNIEVEGIFHLGMYSSSPMYKKDPALVAGVVKSAVNIFEMAKRLKVHVVYASTSSMYTGNPVPWKEDAPIDVFDYYTEGRYYLERMAELYHRLYDVSSVGMRFFSVYGPNEESKENFANLVSQFLWDMKNGKAPVIYGDGEQKRDFIYVDDIVRALKLASSKTDCCEVVNSGTGKSYSLNELIGILNRLLGTDIKAEYVDNPIKNYVPETLADCNKAKQFLNFEAEMTLEEGIKRLL